MRRISPEVCPEGSVISFGFLIPVRTGCQSGESIGLVSLSESEQNYRPKPDDVKFAIENGVVQENQTNYLNPDETITYGELFKMLERLLIICGDL